MHTDKSMLSRKRRVSRFLKALPPKKSLDALGEPRKLVMLQFYAAIERFVRGAYEDCILGCAFSVEIGLLLRLDEKLRDSEKEDIRKRNRYGLTFRKTINLSKIHNLLDEDSFNQGLKLNNLRNMFSHPGNWVTFIKLQSLPYLAKMMPEIVPESRALIGGVEDIAKQKLEAMEKAAKDGEKYVDKRLGRIPDFQWAANQDTLDFQQKEATKYYAKVVRDVLHREGFIDFTQHLDKLPQYAQQRFPYLQELALEAMGITFEILQHLKIIHLDAR